MTFTITEATFLTAVVSLGLMFITWRQFRLNAKQIRLQFLSGNYESILRLTEATTITVEKWIADLASSTVSFQPSQSVSISEVLAQKKASDEVRLKLELYPNNKVNPIVEKWMIVLLTIMTDFEDLYPKSPMKGTAKVSIAARNQTLEKLTSGLTTLKSTREQVVSAMVEEIKIPK